MIKKNNFFFNIQQHSYHLVTFSPWPLLSALSGWVVTTGGVMYMHSYKGGLFTLFFGIGLVLMCMFVWWRDVIRESTYEGMHTKSVQIGLRYGVVLFIVTEIFFFLAFFWGFFHASLAPCVELGSVWPPKGIASFNPWKIPLINTCILLLSGYTITYAHHYLMNYNVTTKKHYKNYIIEGFLLTLFLAVFFTAFQVLEYLNASFSIWDGVYGTTFFMATGFHGAHVIIGTIFISVCFFRYLRGHFTGSHHFGFEAAAWYWHFVDVVWLFLFVSIYWWGSLSV
jgi:heme/copper-type cytochrome/quinol oxidase subunit 3